MDGRAVYSIGAVGRMIGVPTSTLRSWEDRYGLIVPHRTSGGHRLYSRDQVDQLKFVAAKVAEGMQPGDAHRLLDAGETPSAAARHDRPTAGLVVIAERDRFAAELEEYFLRTEGYDVTVTLDIAQASAVLAESGAHVVIVDLLLEGGGGVELCGRLAASNETRVLAVSSLDTREEALAAGAHAFLTKPLDPLQLVSTVRDLLGDSAYLGSAP
ncbi:MAG: MerR family transcriptional regulator [Acidimicrobiales bacterium]